MAHAPFFSLDGLDGAGKSTQSRLLADWLRSHGWQVVECRDPGGTPIGQAIRQLLLDPQYHMNTTCEMLLFMASRAQLVSDVIRPALQRGEAVVCDRFLLANMVYQGYAGGLDPDTIRNFGLLATGQLEPDMTFVLDLPPEQAQLRQRGKSADRMEQRDRDFHVQVRTGFLAEAQRRAERLKLLDASRSVEVVHQEICEIVAGFLSQAGPRPGE